MRGSTFALWAEAVLEVQGKSNLLRGLGFGVLGFRISVWSYLGAYRAYGYNGESNVKVHEK